MAVKWHVIAKHRNGNTTSVRLATDPGKDSVVAELHRIGCEVTIVDLEQLKPEKTPDYPPVPTLAECKARYELTTGIPWID
jgi:hypothetical protein